MTVLPWLSDSDLSIPVYSDYSIRDIRLALSAMRWPMFSDDVDVADYCAIILYSIISAIQYFYKSHQKVIQLILSMASGYSEKSDKCS